MAAVGKVLDVKEGDAFGELALMYDAPRAATVIAASDVVTWALDQITFKKTLKDTTIKKRNMLQEFLKDVPILRLLSEYERLTLADALIGYTCSFSVYFPSLFLSIFSIAPVQEYISLFFYLKNKIHYICIIYFQLENEIVGTTRDPTKTFSSWK